MSDLETSVALQAVADSAKSSGQAGPVIEITPQMIEAGSMHDVLAAIGWAFDRHRFLVGLCLGWCLALTLNTFAALFLF